MAEETPFPDPPMTSEEQERVAQLTANEIVHVSDRQLKVRHIPTSCFQLRYE